MKIEGVVMFEIIGNFFERIKLSLIVTVVSIVFVLILQILRLFGYDVLGRNQLIILPVLLFISYGVPLSSFERLQIFSWDKYRNLYYKLRSIVGSVLLLGVGIGFMGVSIITKDAFLFYTCFFVFNFSGFSLSQIGNEEANTQEYIETRNAINDSKDHFNDLY